MEQLQTDVAVLGCGAAGAAIATSLARKTGLTTTVVYRGEEEGSSFSNQKWKHSGALYPARDLAREAWECFETMDQYGETPYILSRGALLLSDDDAILDGLRRDWEEWGIEDWGLKIADLERNSGMRIGSFGRSRLIGGFTSPDCVLDFPRLIGDLRAQLKSVGALLKNDARVLRLVRDGNRITGVILQIKGRELQVKCRHCIVALGAWSLPLLRAVEVNPPVRLTKSNVAVFDRELVDRICVWIRHELTIVPYRGTTLVCDARFRVVADADDLEPDREHLPELLNDLRECFPEFVGEPRFVRGCIKTSGILGNGMPDPRSVRFDADQPEIFRHGIEGLSVVFPGKASFMWRVAEDATTHVSALLA